MLKKRDTPKCPFKHSEKTIGQIIMNHEILQYPLRQPQMVAEEEILRSRHVHHITVVKWCANSHPHFYSERIIVNITSMVPIDFCLYPIIYINAIVHIVHIIWCVYTYTYTNTHLSLYIDIHTYIYNIIILYIEAVCLATAALFRGNLGNLRSRSSRCPEGAGWSYPFFCWSDTYMIIIHGLICMD